MGKGRVAMLDPPPPASPRSPKHLQEMRAGAERSRSWLWDPAPGSTHRRWQWQRPLSPCFRPLNQQKCPDPCTAASHWLVYLPIKNCKDLYCIKCQVWW